MRSRENQNIEWNAVVVAMKSVDAASVVIVNQKHAVHVSPRMRKVLPLPRAKIITSVERLVLPALEGHRVVLAPRARRVSRVVPAPKVLVDSAVGPDRQAL